MGKNGGNQPQLTLTLSPADSADTETTADSESAEETKVSVSFFREDVDVTPELTSFGTRNNMFCETTLDSCNNLVMLDFTPNDEFSNMAMCRNLVSHVQRMFKRLDRMHPGAGPTAKVRVVTLGANTSLFHTLTNMRDYVVKYLRRDFDLCEETFGSDPAGFPQLA